MALGTSEILVIVGLAVFLFGAPKVIEWARGLAKAKKAYQDELEKKDEPPNPATPKV